jgi:N-acetyl sugar amidotransferase
MEKKDMEKKDVIGRYNLPAEVQFCNTCTVSNQRPRITFDKDGVCSACNFSIYKHKEVDWGEREKELIDLCQRHKKNNGEHDVIVPCSGGKDGSYVAHQLKYKYGMNPLCVTWAPIKSTEIGRKNLESFISAGFDHILGTPNPIVTRKLTNLTFKHVGDPFQPFIYGQYNFPIQIAVKYKVSLIMYGENGEVEYGGDMKTAFRPDRPIEDQDKMYFSGLPPEFWFDHGLSEADLNYFMPPPHQEIIENDTKVHFYGYYKLWDPQENFYYCTQNTGFSTNPERSEGTYSKYSSLDDCFDGFHFYLAYIKFGIGRATANSAHEIRDGKISREEGIALVQKYDGEFPKKYFHEFLEYCSIKENEFNEIIDSWRSDHIWKQTNGVWSLKKSILDAVYS